MPVSTFLFALWEWIKWRKGMKLVPKDAVVVDPPPPPDPPSAA
jgi:hypothetical protein